MGVRALPSGRHQARFIYEGTEYRATLDSRSAAEEWAKRTRRALVAGTYVDPDTGRAPGDTTPLLGEYAARWIAEGRLKPRTRAEYTTLLQHFGGLAAVPVNRITRDDVRAWHKGLTIGTTTKRHAYELLRAVMNGALDDDLIPGNPVRIRGAANNPRRAMPTLPTAVQVHEMADSMPSPKYRLMLLLSAWCGLRFGETTELRRKDVLLDPSGLPTSLRIRRAVTRADGQYVTGTPKSAAGVRVISIPPHIRADVQAYLDNLASGPEVMLFPGSRNGSHMAPSSLYKVWYPARDAAGLPNLRWHDLRHFSATMAAQSGATLAELMRRIGHSTPAAAMLYQHSSAARDEAIAAAMSAQVAQPDPAGVIVRLPLRA